MKVDPEKVRRSVAEALGTDVRNVALDARLTDIAQIDSLSLVEIASAIDESLGIRLPGNSLSEVLTVGDLVLLAERSPRR